MTLYERQSLVNFQTARNEALAFFGERGLDLRLNFNDSLVLQAAADLLSRQVHFCGYQVMELTKMDSGAVYPLLHKFERRGIFASSKERRNSVDPTKAPRRLYTATEMGGVVLGFFGLSQENDK